MAFPVGSNKSAFTASIGLAEVRTKEAQEKLEHDFEALIRNSEETIKKLQEEIGVLKKEIVVLQSRAKENEMTKIALISALRTEIDLERERREQAEAERNYLLEIFNERKVPYPNFSDLIRASSPITAEYIKEERFRDYNSWQEALAGFAKVKDQKK